MKQSLLEEGEEEHLGRLRGHDVENADELPAELIIFLVLVGLLKVPQHDQSSNLEVQQNYKHPFLKSRRI
jgi:hypothetical protein